MKWLESKQYSIVGHDTVFEGEWIFSNRHVMFLYNTWHSTENEVSLLVVTFSLESLALKQKSTAGTASVLCQVGTLIEGSGSTDIYYNSWNVKHLELTPYV